MDSKVKCPGCGFDVSTKEEGTRFRSHKVKGEKCHMSNEPVPDWDDEETDTEERTAVPGEVLPDADPAGYPDDATPLESSEIDSKEPETSDEGDDAGDTPEEPQRSTESPPELPVFVYALEVNASCPYLNDRVWHASNSRMAEKKALKAGRLITGEAQHVDTQVKAGKIVLTYEVPVR